MDLGVVSEWVVVEVVGMEVHGVTVRLRDPTRDTPGGYQWRHRVRRTALREKRP